MSEKIGNYDLPNKLPISELKTLVVKYKKFGNPEDMEIIFHTVFMGN